MHAVCVICSLCFLGVQVARSPLGGIGAKEQVKQGRATVVARRGLVMVIVVDTIGCHETGNRERIARMGDVRANQTKPQPQRKHLRVETQQHRDNDGGKRVPNDGFQGVREFCGWEFVSHRKITIAHRHYQQRIQWWHETRDAAYGYDCRMGPCAI